MTSRKNQSAEITSAEIKPQSDAAPMRRDVHPVHADSELSDAHLPPMTVNFEALARCLAPTMSTLVLMLGLLCLAASAASAKTITVTGIGDTIAVDGVVTLREAITAANTNAPSGDAPAGDSGLDVINFNIPGGGVKTISPTSALPAISEPITINGYTQPGASPNTLALGSDAVLLIELNGANAGASANGLTLNGGNSTIRGLVINRFSLQGIAIQTNDGNVVAGNFIGTNPAGTANFPVPNCNVGVYVKSANNIIGGSVPADRNVVSGIASASGGTGVWLDTITAHNNKVIGNYIGTDASGTTTVGTFNNGLSISGTSNIIGGTTSAERNVISGNNSNGIGFGGIAANNQVIGNFIGTKADGVSPLQNGQAGIDIENGPTNNTIGGTAAGAGNVIAFNNGFGVFIFQSANNAILGNSIYSSANGLGIDLYTGAFGVTPNDDNTGDADTGANNLQNFPVITSAVSSGGTTTIKGTLDSAFSTQFRLEFFSNTAPNVSGFGEGQTFLGFVNAITDASGKAAFTFNVPTANVAGTFFSATATDPAGNTSEFSACASGVVNSPGTLQLSTNSITQLENSGGFSINVVRTNGSTGTVTVQYATTDGTAKAPSDYTSTSGTLTFNDGETSKPINVPIIDDNTPEGNESFTLSLSNPTGGAVPGNITSATFFIQDNELPTLSINDVSQSEGNSGTTAFSFTVTSSNVITNNVDVSFATANGTATAGSDYQATNGVLTIPAGQTTKTITVTVSGDATQEPDETFFVNLSNSSNATISKTQGIGTIINDDNPAAPTVQFSSTSYSVQEDLTALTVTVTRSGDMSGSASVNYASVDGTATQKGDFELALGTLNFAPGDASKTFQVLINEDMYVEGSENFTLSLSNPSGTSLGQQSTATGTINDDAPESLTNPIDDSQSFIHMQYHDFLSREPEPQGLQFYLNILNGCQPSDTECTKYTRGALSANFFRSPEFQAKGSYVMYLYMVSIGQRPVTAAELPSKNDPTRNDRPHYSEFMSDMQTITSPNDLNGPDPVKKAALTAAWVQRPEFVSLYPAGLTNAQFALALANTAGVTLSAATQSAVTAAANRAEILRIIAESPEVNARFYQQAFVTMEYFGYLRRDPEDCHNSANWFGTGDPNACGYIFHNNRFQLIANPDLLENTIVRGFIESPEYRQRFGP